MSRFNVLSKLVRDEIFIKIDNETEFVINTNYIHDKEKKKITSRFLQFDKENICFGPKTSREYWKYVCTNDVKLPPVLNITNKEKIKQPNNMYHLHNLENINYLNDYKFED